MLSLSYSITDDIKKKLKTLSEVRTNILLSPMTPKAKLALRYDAMIRRITTSFHGEDPTLTQERVIGAMTSLGKPLTPTARDMVGYRRALDWIRQDWPGNPAPITLKIIKELAGLLWATPSRSTGSNKILEGSVRELLTYLESAHEHPLVEAAIARSQLIVLSPYREGSGRLGDLLAYIILTKYGWDYRGILVLEEVWARNPEIRRDALSAIAEGRSSNMWLSYTIEGIEEQCNLIEQSVTKQSKTDKRLLSLNRRGEKILALLANPASKITNKDVQKLFAISQITASRDLAKLATIGLLFTHGRGRSIFYTRA